ncbi:MAG TPA: DUF882 domain-containing protein [Candidatus Binataceae bacterium]|nr:DUF882 domain-containing protein [Candidatus Binataceae bacterium]
MLRGRPTATAAPQSDIAPAETSFDRRRFLRMAGMVAAAASLAPAGALAMITAPATPRRLKFYNLHTGEQLDIVYFEKGRYIPQALAEIDFILRDYRQNVVKPIHPRLLDLVVAIRRRLRSDAEVAIISGYRTPQTNAMLAARSDGVAHHSLHMDGMALDWRVPGRTLEQLHRAALSLRGGGVGYYPASDFVHTDVGRVRYW